MQLLHELTQYNTLVILAGTTLMGLVAGLVGTFTVLRQRALAGDVFAHATLPGLCLAFIAIEERKLWFLLAGAAVTGFLAMLLVSSLTKNARVKDDSALALVLGVFFGMGIVLSRWIQNQTTEGSKAGLDSFLLGKTSGMILTDVYFIAMVSFISLIVVILLFKEFQLMVFDPGFASVSGWPVGLLDLILMCLMGLVVVAGLTSVGIVLITALLVIPAAAARFWTNRLLIMCCVSSAIGMFASISGVIFSTLFEDLPTGAFMTLSAAFAFVISAIFAPCRGWFWSRKRKKMQVHNTTLAMELS
ncbi:MAG: metal ABC transporter permease [Isosphaeraceae bacterium]